MTILASCLFCDDVRTEANGKRILIGVYDKDLIAAQLPFRLSRLFLAVTIEALGSDLPTLKAIRVDWPGHAPQSHAIPEVRPQIALQDAEAGRQTAHLFIQAGPFEITETGFLRVYIETEAEGDIPAGSLLLRTIEQVSQDPLARDGFVDVGAMLAALQHYRRAKDRKVRDMRGLARVITEFLLTCVPSAALAGGDPMKPTQIETRPNRFRILFDQPRVKVPKVHVKPVGEGHEGRVMHVDKYGFEVAFDAKAARVTNVEFEILE